MLTITAAARPLCVIISGSRSLATHFTMAVASWRRSVIGTIFGILTISDISYDSFNGSTNGSKWQVLFSGKSIWTPLNTQISTDFEYHSKIRIYLENKSVTFFFFVVRRFQEKWENHG